MRVRQNSPISLLKSAPRASRLPKKRRKLFSKEQREIVRTHLFNLKLLFCCLSSFFVFRLSPSSACAVISSALSIYTFLLKFPNTSFVFTTFAKESGFFFIMRIISPIWRLFIMQTSINLSESEYIPCTLI